MPQANRNVSQRETSILGDILTAGGNILDRYLDFETVKFERELLANSNRTQENELGGGIVFPWTNPSASGSSGQRDLMPLVLIGGAVVAGVFLLSKA